MDSAELSRWVLAHQPVGVCWLRAAWRAACHLQAKLRRGRGKHGDGRRAWRPPLPARSDKRAALRELAAAWRRARSHGFLCGGLDRHRPKAGYQIERFVGGARLVHLALGSWMLQCSASCRTSAALPTPCKNVPSSRLRRCTGCTCPHTLCVPAAASLFCRWQGTTDESGAGSRSAHQRERSGPRLEPASPRPFGAWFAEYVGGELPRVSTGSGVCNWSASGTGPIPCLHACHTVLHLHAPSPACRLAATPALPLPCPTGLVPRRNHGSAPQQGAAATALVLCRPAGAVGRRPQPRGRPLPGAQLGQHLLPALPALMYNTAVCLPGNGMTEGNPRTDLQM